MTLTEQFATMIAMTAMGGWVGACLSVYHRFIHPRKKWHWIMILTDVLFWAVQGLFVFLVLLNINEGEIRFYIFLALALGFSAYKALIEKLFERCLEIIIRIIRSTSIFIGRTFSIFFVQPTIVLLKLFYGLVKMVGRFLLAVFLFLFSIIFIPLKWLFRLFIPKSWIEKTKSYFRTVKTFVVKIKTILEKWVKKWK